MITAAIWLAFVAHVTLWAYTVPYPSKLSTEENMATTTIGFALSAAVIATLAVNR